MSDKGPVKLYKVSKAAELLGVSCHILRQWDNEGKIQAVRSPGGIRLFDISGINPNILAKSKAKNAKKVVLYSRVSSAKQKDDLERQRKFLSDNIPDEYSGHEVLGVSDIGSGLNFKRPGLLRVLGSVKEGDVSRIVVSSRDRLARFGFELIEWLCKEYGVEIVVLDNRDSTPEEELGKDLMSIVQVYCCRWNGKRRYVRKENNQNIQAEIETDSESEEDVKTMVGMPEVYLQSGNQTAPEKEEHNKKQNIPTKQVRRKKDKSNQENK